MSDEEDQLDDKHETADAESVARKERRRKLQELHDRADIRAVLKTDEGCRVLHRLLEMAGVYRISYVTGDPHGTSFHEGGRNVGLRMIAEIEKSHDGLYETMLRTAKLSKKDLQ